MESFPPQENGDNFIGLYGTLNFHVPLTGWGLAKYEGFKLFQSFFGGWGLVGAEQRGGYIRKSYLLIPS